METEFSYDWSKFVKRITVNAPLERIYEAWTTKKGLESWFLRSAEFKSSDGNLLPASQRVVINDTYEWFWHGWDDNTVENGKILEADGKDYLKFVFGKAGTVSVKIFSEAGEIVVELLQEKIPIDEKDKVNYHMGCSTGWTFYLANLKSVLEGGIDLRNKNVKIFNVVNS